MAPQLERGKHYGLHVPGRHMVLPRSGLRVGERTDLTGREFLNLTAARQASKTGDAIVRCEDSVVVSVK